MKTWITRFGYNALLGRSRTAAKAILPPPLEGMKLGVIRRECGHGLGGAEAYCAHVCSMLKPLGWDLTVVGSWSLLEDVNHHEVKTWGRGSLLKNLTFFFNAQRLLKKRPFDVTYGLSRVAPVDVLRVSDPLHAVWIHAGYSGSPRFRTLRPRHMLLLWMEAKSLRAARTIVANSHLVAAQLSRSFRIPGDRIHVLYNGVDLKRFKPLSEKDRKYVRREFGVHPEHAVILFAGSDLRRKGFHSLIRALAEMNEPPWTLWVAGTKGTARLRKKLQRLGALDRVRWLGPVRTMERLYGAADLFVLPTLYDPFANTSLESLASGTPCLTTLQNGASELVRQVAPFLVVPDAESGALRGAIERYLAMDPVERDLIRHRSAELAAGYTWEVHAARLNTLLLQHAAAFE